jgi:hypothetical protein
MRSAGIPSVDKLHQHSNSSTFPHRIIGLPVAMAIEARSMCEPAVAMPGIFTWHCLTVATLSERRHRDILLQVKT